MVEEEYEEEPIGQRGGDEMGRDFRRMTRHHATLSDRHRKETPNFGSARPLPNFPPPHQFIWVKYLVYPTVSLPYRVCVAGLR